MGGSGRDAINTEVREGGKICISAINPIKWKGERVFHASSTWMPGKTIPGHYLTFASFIA